MLFFVRVSILALLLFSFSKNEVVAQYKFSLSGIIPKMYDGVRVNLTSLNSNFEKLTTITKNGRFQLSGKIEREYEYVVLSIFKDEKRITWWNIFLKKGKSKIEILKLDENKDNTNALFKNIHFTDKQIEYKSLIKPSENIHRSTFNLLQTTKKYNSYGYNIDSLEDVVKGLKKKIISQKIEFIRSNPDSYYSLYILDSEIINLGLNILYVELDTLSNLFSMLDISVKNTQLGKSVESYLLKRKSLLVNQFMPNFSFSATDGKQYELSSFRNEKYVLLCFWDSWCLPCIKSIPILKRIDSSYSEIGLQVISLSIDNDEKKWHNSLIKYEMPWLQSCDLPKYIKGLPIRDLYDIKYIPQYFLIDKNGKLIYHNSQLDDDDDFSILRNMLESLLDY